jgi:programmed cell death protein 5
LKSQGSSQNAGSSSDSQGEAREAREAEARQSILGQILQPEAADRINRIKLVKPQRASDVENRLIMLAKSGQLRGKVTEEQLKDLLGALAENEEKSGGGKIKVLRQGRRDDDDELDDLMAELEDN